MKQHDNIYHTDKFLTQDRSCLKALWRLSLCLCQNNNIRVLEEAVLLHFLRNIWLANNFFCIFFVSYGIALPKHMVKQVEVIFFPSDKKFEWPCYIENSWEKARIRLSTWIKVGCRKGISYQTTRITHWNLQRITNVNAIMRCDIFNLFVGRNKKRKPVMEGNFRLNIHIEGHAANHHCLFWYFKDIWPFLLTLIH